MSGGILEPIEAGANILIVDDLPDHLAFAGAILRQQGYRVHAAASGKAALAFLERHAPDLIVLDVHMEGMDGLELCRRIKQQESTKDIPVIFVTADSHPAAITAGFEAGCCDYVSKPFVRAEYLARISAHLRIAQQTRALADAYDELDRFCSAVSHDLKSPLGASGWSGMVAAARCGCGRLWQHLGGAHAAGQHPKCYDSAAGLRLARSRECAFLQCGWSDRLWTGVWAGAGSRDRASGLGGA